MKRIPHLLICLLTIILFATACGPKRAVNEKRYPLKGKVVSVNKSERTATIKHEDIPGYMPGMTMPFKIKNDADLEMLKAGDDVSANLVVTAVDSWIEVTAIVEGNSPLTATTEVPGEPKPGDEIPDFALVNQDGKRVRLSQYKGSALAITFVYTRCPQPDQCTLMSTNFASVDKALQAQPDVYSRTHLLTISFDPDYDTPKVMRSYGASHTGKYSDETFQHWEFLTGTADEVKGVAQYFGLRYFHDTDSGDEQVIHSLRTGIIGPDGKLFKLYRGNDWKPDQVVEDLRTLAGQAK